VRGLNDPSLARSGACELFIERAAVEACIKKQSLYKYANMHWVDQNHIYSPYMTFGDFSVKIL